jgi:hypothetical protein
MAIKSSDYTCFPLCGPGFDDNGCHWFIGSSGAFTREERRKLERDYAAQTRETLKGTA